MSPDFIVNSAFVIFFAFSSDVFSSSLVLKRLGPPTRVAPARDFFVATANGSKMGFGGDLGGRDLAQKDRTGAGDLFRVAISSGSKIGIGCVSGDETWRTRIAPALVVFLVWRLQAA